MKHIRAWGETAGYKGLKTSPLTEALSINLERPIFDTIAAIICHGVFDRHPSLKVVSLELGASWVPELRRRLRSAYGKTPQDFGADPVYEDDLATVFDAVGADRLLLGSDWPHPEGLSAPRAWLADFAALGDGDRRKVLRENLKALSGR
jgi:predicted TIM-barrel fold metal-dependent hydrolase